MNIFITLTSILIFAFSLLPSQLYAAGSTYYVTQNGIGLRDGKSLANAWSISDFNALRGTGYAGDTFYFSGAINSGIVMGISGTSGGGDVILDGYAAGNCDPINAICSSSAIIDRNDPGSGTYRGIDIKHQSYITIQDFRITDCSEGVYEYDSTKAYLSSNITVKRTDLYVIREKGLYFGYATYITIGGASGDGNKIYNMGLGSLSRSACSGITHLRINDSIVSYNHMYNDSQSYSQYPDAIVTLYTNRMLVEYNRITGWGEDAIDFKDESSVLIFRFNYCDDFRFSAVKFGLDASYGYVYGNFLAGATQSGVLGHRDANNLHIWSNIITNNVSSGISISDGVNTVYIKNNTLSYNDTGLNSLHSGFYNSSASTFQAKNNLLYYNQPGGTNERQAYNSQAAAVLDHNTYYYDAVDSPAIYSEGSNYVLTGSISATKFLSATYQEQNSHVEDPLFADPDGADNTYGTDDDDYTLVANSPCIDDGADLSQCFSVKVQGIKYAPCVEDALDPYLTDWTTIPPTVRTKKQRENGAWERGAYVYTGSEKSTLIPPTGLQLLQ